MLQLQKQEILWLELTSIKNIDERKVIIHNDIKSKSLKYQLLAEQDPHRLFKLLGGDDSKIEKMNWAFEYNYEDYIENFDIEYDSDEADEWDLEGKSIDNAHENGHWYVTGISKIEGPENIELVFEFEYCEGYLEGIIGTPYNENEHGNHGILF